MKKVLVVIMTLALVMSSVGTAIAAPAVPSDVAGTRYEAAVVNLLDNSVFTGYEDGAFRPEDTLTRAEICVILTKAMGATQAELDAAPAADLKDIGDYPWATKYVNYAVEKGLITGYGDRTFRPAAKLNFNEMVTLLILAMKVDPDLDANWPENYVNKATEMGILNEVPDSLITAKITDKSIGGTTHIQRGDVAIMINNALEQLRAVNAQ